MNGDSRQLDEATLVEEALALPPEKRVEFLDRACGEDASQRARIEARLAEVEEPETLVEAPGQDRTNPLPSDEEATRIAPPAPDPYQLTGTTVAQYEVGERLGKGGMGIVYKALDTRLHRTVALKFLRLSLSEEAHARDRFFAEARSASALDHTNICTVHEVGDAAERGVFIVMGYYEGKTLGEKIGGQALPQETALDYAQQIVSGLAAAHSKGILHRDLKPANVMVTQPEAGAEHGVLKILDFGLAKMEGIELTRTGTTMGTLAYMSPEQARGERVDPRADIWSVGVMLYEMLTGGRPFKVSNELAMLQALANDEIQAPSLKNPEVPAELDQIVLKCLSKDKEGRYADAGELLAALREFYRITVSQTLSGLDRALPPADAPTRRWRSPAGVAVIVIAVVALLLAVPATRRLVLGRGSASAPPGPLLVAVLPFVNSLGPSSENQALSDGLTHSMTGLIASLARGADTLWVVPASEIFEQGVATAGDAQKYFGVDRVLTGSVLKTGEDIEISLNLVDPLSKPPRTLDSRLLTAPLNAALRDRASVQLAGLLGLEWSSDGELAGPLVDSTSAAAYTLYLQGVGFLQRHEGSIRYDEAVRIFNLVLEEDPEYGPAHAGLCQGLWEIYRQRDDPQIAEQAALSCERAAELSSNEAMVLVSVGRSYVEMGQWRRAKTELERALELEPDNAEAHRWAGWAAFDAGRPEEAIAAFEKAIEAEPEIWSYLDDYGELLISLGRYEAAAEQFERASRLTPENYDPVGMLAVVRRDLGQDEEAERLFLRSLELDPSSLAYRNFGFLRFRQGRYQEAVENLEEARDLVGVTPLSNDWVTFSWLAHAYHWAGQEEAARETWRQLVDLLTMRYEVNPREVNGLAALSDAHAALGEEDKARFYLSRLLAVPIEANYIYFYIGRTYEMVGDRELALTYTERALEERYDPRAVDSDPWLAGLRSEPSYQALRQQYLNSGS